MSKPRGNEGSLEKAGQAYKVSSISRKNRDRLRTIALSNESGRVVKGPSVTSDNDVNYILVYQMDANYEKPFFAR
ncbi:hypothetical protein A8L34_28385 [Bacillus sp. FJAT-27264]|uniref:hypothetical protein n=1 Tax=Paenibacillus sp. (strain DSM 101736 / FJAT-27264) TaxID=1850362 RepID=UPI000807B7A6|nr:hypothetical protein [Bacillus sp. FJAT-27264]OBZ15717.1 hypothetical protein A8L34_28385 [Bacillus sp. FJAT-27264]